MYLVSVDGDGVLIDVVCAVSRCDDDAISGVAIPLQTNIAW